MLTMCDQIHTQYPDNEWIAIPAQPILPSMGTITPDSDVESRVNLFMQTTGRGLQGQYWRKSAFELSKWLTAQIQYERQGWQLKLQTALKEIESHRRDALMADKVLSDSLDLLLECMGTCNINYNAKVSALSNKKQLLGEYVEVLTEILKFLILERSQCFYLLERKPDLDVNLAECIRQFLDAEIQSKKETKSCTEKHEELDSMISDLRNDVDSFQKAVICENLIPMSCYQKHTNNNFTIRKYKKRRFGSVSPLVNRFDASIFKTNAMNAMNKPKSSDCEEEDKNMANSDMKTKNLQESLKSLNTKEDKNGKSYIVSNPINVTEMIMKPSVDRPPTGSDEPRTLRSDDSSRSDNQTLYSLPPIKGKQIKEVHRKTGSTKRQLESIQPTATSPSMTQACQSAPITTHSQIQQPEKIKKGHKCSRCKGIYKITENQKLSCHHHSEGKKGVDKLDETGNVIKNCIVYID